MPDSRRLVAAGENGSATVWDAENGKISHAFGVPNPRPQFVRGFKVPIYGIINIDVSPDGGLIATAAGSEEARVWTAATGKQLFTVPHDGGDSDTADVEWSPDGALLATASGEGVARIVDRSGAEIAKLREEPGYNLIHVSFSPDGRLLATVRWPTWQPEGPGTPIHEVKIWDWRQGKVLRRIDTVSEVAVFDPTGTHLATSHPDGYAEIWDIPSTRKIMTLAGHTGGVLDVAFSPDGSLIATAGQDGTVRLWNTESGDPFLVLQAHTTPVSNVTFSPDGSKLASASAGMVRVWALDLDDLIEIANRGLTRGLTREECRRYLHVDQCRRPELATTASQLPPAMEEVLTLSSMARHWGLLTARRSFLRRLALVPPLSPLSVPATPPRGPRTSR
jgi:WD40 repeat protein